MFNFKDLTHFEPLNVQKNQLKYSNIFQSFNSSW